MYFGRRVGVVVPCYNAEEHIGKVIATMPQFVDVIILVDDGSTDRSVQRAQKTGDNRLLIIKHHQNRGVGAAITTGYKRAIKMGIDLVAVMAADGQMDPADLPSLLDAIIKSDADYAKGNRFAYAGASIVFEMPPLRLFGNVALSIASKPITGYWQVFDSQCGYTVIKRQTLERINLNALWKRYGYPNDLLARLHEIGAKVVEVPVKPIYHDGHSKMQLLRTALRFPPLLMQIWARRLLNERLKNKKGAH